MVELQQGFTADEIAHFTLRKSCPADVPYGSSTALWARGGRVGSTPPHRDQVDASTELRSGPYPASRIAANSGFIR
jgi:hypothetical protein